MSAIDKLSKEQRDALMSASIEALIIATVRGLDVEGKTGLAEEWDRLKDSIVHIVNHARDEIFESRKRVAVIRQAFKGRSR